jgi:4-diphosphocytidyl-2-C-methyl-D-erythritol kinase
VSAETARPESPRPGTPPPGTPLALEAPAKLNLSLAVLGRRPDGYHELASVFVLLELADRLLLMPGCSGLRVEAAGDEDVPYDPPRNLAWRGLVAGLGDEPDLACLTLEKRIPAGAGLGGGSSDAAAGWRLGRRWIGADEVADSDQLNGLAAIGADVPFFATALPAAFVSGVGERIEPLASPARPRDVLLVHPPFALSTAEVFAALRPDDWSASPPSAAIVPGTNDLLDAARRLRPELDDIIEAVSAAGVEPHLTGSGPTFFAVGDEPERLDAAAARLHSRGLRTTRTRTRRRAASIEAIEEEEP